MRLSLVLCLGVIAALFSLPASALPLNDYNEVQNPDFETGDLSSWQSGVDIIVAPDGPSQGYSATCKAAGGDTWLRQIVDDSLSPEWNWDYHQKLVDLVAKITWTGWEPPDSLISFRLDWWSEQYNSVNNPESLPYYLGPPPAGPDPAAGYFVTDWVSYSFLGIPGFEWTVVNPFDRILLPEQPRWISVEVLFTQASGESVWLDDVMLTGRCIPEPSSLASLIGAFSMVLAGFGMRRMSK